MENKSNGFFTTLYRTRFKVAKGDATVLNLSVLFSVISLLSAPWLVVIGLIVALVLGYRFSIDRNGLGFQESFDGVVKNAASNIKQTVDDLTGKKDDTNADE